MPRIREAWAFACCNELNPSDPKIETGRHVLPRFQDKTLVTLEPYAQLEATEAARGTSIRQNCLVVTDAWMITSQADQGLLKFYQVCDGKLMARVGWNELITSMAAVSEATVLCLGLQSGYVGMWALASGHYARSKGKHLESVTLMTKSADTQTLLTGSSDGTVKVWKVANAFTVVSDSLDEDERATLNPERTIRLSAALTCLYAGRTSGRKHVVAGTADGKLALCNFENGQMLRTFLLGEGRCPTAVTMDNLDAGAYVGFKRGPIQHINFQPGNVAEGDFIEEVRSVSGRQRPSAHHNLCQGNWGDFNQMRPFMSVAMHGAVLSMMLSFDNSKLLTSHESGSVLSWDVGTRTLLCEIVTLPDAASNICSLGVGVIKNHEQFLRLRESAPHIKLLTLTRPHFATVWGAGPRPTRSTDGGAGAGHSARVERSTDAQAGTAPSPQIKTGRAPSTGVQAGLPVPVGVQTSFPVSIGVQTRVPVSVGDQTSPEASTGMQTDGGPSEVARTAASGSPDAQASASPSMTVQTSAGPSKVTQSGAESLPVGPPRKRYRVNTQDGMQWLGAYLPCTDAETGKDAQTSAGPSKVTQPEAESLPADPPRKRYKVNTQNGMQWLGAYLPCTDAETTSLGESGSQAATTGPEETQGANIDIMGKGKERARPDNQRPESTGRDSVEPELPPALPGLTRIGLLVDHLCTLEMMGSTQAPVETPSRGSKRERPSLEAEDMNRSNHPDGSDPSEGSDRPDRPDRTDNRGNWKKARRDKHERQWLSLDCSLDDHWGPLQGLFQEQASDIPTSDVLDEAEQDERISSIPHLREQLDNVKYMKQHIALLERMQRRVWERGMMLGVNLADEGVQQTTNVNAGQAETTDEVMSGVEDAVQPAVNTDAGIGGTLSPSIGPSRSSAVAFVAPRDVYIHTPASYPGTIPLSALDLSEPSATKQAAMPDFDAAADGYTVEENNMFQEFLVTEVSSISGD